MTLAVIERSAILSEDGVYRYTLERHWDRALGHALFILLNPSVADAERDDPTLRRGMSFAREWGLGGVVFVNLFAFRATDPLVLKKESRPVGLFNDEHIEREALRAKKVIASWGIHGRHHNRDLAVWRLLRGKVDMFCFGLTQDKSPLHPLRLPKGMPLMPFPGVQS